MSSSAFYIRKHQEKQGSTQKPQHQQETVDVNAKELQDKIFVNQLSC